MKKIETPIKDLIILQREIRYDERGSVTRLYGKNELIQVGHPIEIASLIHSTNPLAGTLRGIHFQNAPFKETKIISCTNGSIWDVGIDLRRESPTRFQWFGLELTPTNGFSLLVPEGFGHGFITLKPESTALYAISAPHSLAHENGVRFDDPLIGIKWPHKIFKIAARDLSWPYLEEN